ncbi:MULTISPECIES: hypothetical protein [unclassified Rhizobacter]|uniref:hypothetical protein n=1 Tax=unclassified Rhizobacter TaxID=2640088 RepID=UPI0007020FB3|nr:MULTISPECIES: hypothetical protein [unclassified Rhizobacter]KQU76943.1 hypothetical protein ASC88_03240 [Rhizobacter sp. Root29]KQV97464.1 hypothetical protein ASC98_12770 [Rhizobacter sp. Root1238]KRB10135.1 hypothetical protein ASE08_11405 [Rhizobacter sp. Root16D2]
MSGSNDEMETQLMRWPLRLLLQGLDARDESAVRRFLARASRQLKHDWQVVHDGDADVVMVAGLEVDTVRGMLEPPLMTLHLVPPGQDPRALAWRTGRAPGSVLSSPLQFDALVEALECAEHCATGEVPATFTQLSAGCRFRLRRWPPAGLLWDDAENLRLASFLLTRSLDLEKLMRLSNVSADKCVAFITRMASANLLHLEPVGNGAGPAALPALPLPAAPARRTAPAPGGPFNAMRRWLRLASR